MPPLTCPRNCASHPEHVYILCYGKTVVIREGDCGKVPVSHYVGYTMQRPPVRRVWQHGAGSAAALVEMRPGNLRDELRVKILGSCPACGRSLWYYGPHWPLSPEVLALAGLYVNPADNRRMRLHLRPMRGRRRYR
jgi:hypothetical protein